MFEKVNPSHPDKVADRIAGALVDMAYRREADPKIAVECLIGHGICTIIAETSADLDRAEVGKAVARISGIKAVNLYIVPQEPHLAENQREEIRCGDNGIFRGSPITAEQERLAKVARKIYKAYPTDGKYLLDEARRWFTVCQSNCDSRELLEYIHEDFKDISGHVNPLGPWTGGTDADTGAVNRKLGSDMGDAVTGGGLHGKDLSKADVSVNIYAHIMAQRTHEPVEISCAIGDKTVDGRPYREIVEIARGYIRSRGGFEAFAEWGLI